jgi:hypothetical protein
MRRTLPGMQLTPEEMHRAAMACRAAAYQAEKDAEAQSNPGVKETFRREASAFKALAARFEGQAH